MNLLNHRKTLNTFNLYSAYEVLSELAVTKTEGDRIYFYLSNLEQTLQLALNTMDVSNWIYRTQYNVFMGINNVIPEASDQTFTYSDFWVSDIILYNCIEEFVYSLSLSDKHNFQKCIAQNYMGGESKFYAERNNFNATIAGFGKEFIENIIYGIDLYLQAMQMNDRLFHALRLLFPDDNQSVERYVDSVYKKIFGLTRYELSIQYGIMKNDSILNHIDKEGLKQFIQRIEKALSYLRYTRDFETIYKEVTIMTNSIRIINNLDTHISMSSINHEQDRLTINMVKPIYRM